MQVAQGDPVPLDDIVSSIPVIRHDRKPLECREPIHAHDQGIRARRKIGRNVEDLGIRDARSLSPAREPEQGRGTATQRSLVITLRPDLESRIQELHKDLVIVPNRPQRLPFQHHAQPLARLKRKRSITPLPHTPVIT